MNPSHDKKRATKVFTDAVGFLALGAFALGATALGALAIGALSIRKLRLLEAKAGHLPIDPLTVVRLDLPRRETFEPSFNLNSNSST